VPTKQLKTFWEEKGSAEISYRGSVRSSVPYLNDREKMCHGEEAGRKISDIEGYFV
jgi:hypothetical protein